MNTHENSSVGGVRTRGSTDCNFQIFIYFFAMCDLPTHFLPIQIFFFNWQRSQVVTEWLDVMWVAQWWKLCCNQRLTLVIPHDVSHITLHSFINPISYLLSGFFLSSKRKEYNKYLTYYIKKNHCFVGATKKTFSFTLLKNTLVDNVCLISTCLWFTFLFLFPRLPKWHT